MPKCKICGRNIPKGEEYVVHRMSDTGRLYQRNYCSKEELVAYEKDMEYRSEAFILIGECLGFPRGMLLPQTVNKKLTELSKIGSYRAVYNVIKSLQPKLVQLINKKEFKNTTQKINYFFGIIANDFQDEYAKLKREARLEKVRQQAESTATVEEIVDFMEEIKETQTTTKSKVSDISSFLD